LYSVDPIYIEFCSFVFFITYALLLIPAYYFDEKFGIKNTVCFGIGCNFVGGAIRIGGYTNFWFIFVGSIVSSIGQPFLLNQITKVSVLWFKPNWV
jgi:fucose permease